MLVKRAVAAARAIEEQEQLATDELGLLVRTCRQLKSGANASDVAQAQDVQNSSTTAA